MKRILALALLFMLTATLAHAQFGNSAGAHLDIHWQTGVGSTTGGSTDSLSFRYGASGAGNDTSQWIPTQCILASGPRPAAYIPTADSTMWIRFSLASTSNYAHSGGTSNTVTIQGSADAANAIAMTNLVAIPLTEIGSSDCYQVAISMGKCGVTAMQLVTLPYIRFIVTSNDLVGEYKGRLDFYTACPSYLGQAAAP